LVYNVVIDGKAAKDKKAKKQEEEAMED